MYTTSPANGVDAADVEKMMEFRSGIVKTHVAVERLKSKTISGDSQMSEFPEDAGKLSRWIWETKYRDQPTNGPPEKSLLDSWTRISRILASAEIAERERWERRFYGILEDFKFLPGGRILAGAGTDRNVTLFNCFVMGTIEDSIPGIFRALEEGAVTMQQGGGIGYDFSTLRPRGTRTKGAGTIASGPVSFMDVWDAMCRTILSTGARRGAMMASLRLDHPDIIEFVEAKQESGRLRHFNLSVQVTDDFMEQVHQDGEWVLIFPDHNLEGSGETVLRTWTGRSGPMPCRVFGKVRARDLWNRILENTYRFAEPGVLFVDRINAENNLWYRERISTTNPCGEIPLPPYGACDLGSLNLTRFILEPFSSRARIDLEALTDTVKVAVRFLDNVIDLSRFPLPAQQDVVLRTRRIGLGITGLGDALIMMGFVYGSPESLRWAGDIMRTICHAAYRTSIVLAQDKDPFPDFDPKRYPEGPFIRSLPEDIRKSIASGGLRNSHLLAIAPAGTISLLAGNVSSGIEPAFAASYHREITPASGKTEDLLMTDYAVALYRMHSNGVDPLPPAFVSAETLPVRAHLDMMAALNPYIDNAISKTINVGESIGFEDFRAVYDLAYSLGLKGCTTFRPNPSTGQILTPLTPGVEAPHCCVFDREAD